MLEWTPWIIALLASGTAAVFDVRTRRIPNLLTGPLLAAALVWAASRGGSDGFARGLLGAAIAGGPFILLWLIGGGGAGDSKLMLGLGAWVGGLAAVPLVLAVAIVGGIVSIVYALSRRAAGSAATQLVVLLMSLPLVLSGATGGARKLSSLEDKTERVPYGVAIFGGVCGALAWVAL
jgi:prepilin peptidase CpaA